MFTHIHLHIYIYNMHFVLYTFNYLYIPNAFFPSPMDNGSGINGTWTAPVMIL